MQLVILSRNKGHLAQWSANHVGAWAAVFATVFGSLTFYAGISFAAWLRTEDPEAQVAGWQHEIEQQEFMLTATRDELQQSVDALALRAMTELPEVERADQPEPHTQRDQRLVQRRRLLPDARGLQLRRLRHLLASSAGGSRLRSHVRWLAGP